MYCSLLEILRYLEEPDIILGTDAKQRQRVTKLPPWKFGAFEAEGDSIETITSAVD
ncbi:hypothetical protein ACRALDRAFT_2037502 [Sodiomyces alcalophilus JCM 7366]|uniref:uncharacterized protein n=1 Tax=Sodiomyces alcalophilus JCM 7366 TaxID=591952 RepID=UPI0039B61B66